MARIRTVKPAFFRHSGLYRAEVETGLPLRVAFAGLWTAADKAGRFGWDADVLKLDCLPFDQVDFSRVLDALATRGFIVRYSCDGREFGAIPSWKKHQVINNRESESDIPEPTLTAVITDTSTREPRVADALGTPLMQVKAEGKGREGEGNGERVAREPDAPPRLGPRRSHSILTPPRDLSAAWEGPIFNIPGKWAERTLRASNGTATAADVSAFGTALTSRLTREGDAAPAEGFLGWLDHEWTAWRGDRADDAKAARAIENTRARMAQLQAEMDAAVADVPRG